MKVAEKKPQFIFSDTKQYRLQQIVSNINMELNFDVNKYNMELLNDELDNPIPDQPYAYYCVLVRAQMKNY